MCKQPLKQVIGLFTAISEANVRHIVTVSQEILLNEEGVIISARKVFTLDSIRGEELRRTPEGWTLAKRDGTLLKKNGHCNMHTTITFSRQSHRLRGR